MGLIGAIFVQVVAQLISDLLTGRGGGWNVQRAAGAVFTRYSSGLAPSARGRLRDDLLNHQVSQGLAAVPQFVPGVLLDADGRFGRDDRLRSVDEARRLLSQNLPTLQQILGPRGLEKSGSLLAGGSLLEQVRTALPHLLLSTGDGPELPAHARRLNVICQQVVGLVSRVAPHQPTSQIRRQLLAKSLGDLRIVLSGPAGAGAVVVGAHVDWDQFQQRVRAGQSQVHRRQSWIGTAAPETDAYVAICRMTLQSWQLRARIALRPQQPYPGSTSPAKISALEPDPLLGGQILETTRVAAVQELSFQLAYVTSPATDLVLGAGAA